MLRDLIAEIGLKNIVLWIVAYVVFFVAAIAGGTWVVLSVYRHVMG